MRALLDVNVLIALLDPDHTHHPIATRWLAAQRSPGWASCPITQNGCVRIMAQPSYPNGAPASTIAALLRDAMSSRSHAFWPDDLSIVAEGVLDWRSILGSRQVTDAYLLALAVRRRGRFVTLDRGVAVAAVAGATAKSLVVLD